MSRMQGVVLKSELGARHPLLGMKLLARQGALSDAGRERASDAGRELRLSLCSLSVLRPLPSRVRELSVR